MRTAFFVGRKRPLTDLSPEQQKRIRDAYRGTGFAHNDSEEGICICLGEGAEERARGMCEGKPGWFYYEVPINGCLPEQTADFKGSHFPASEVETIPLAFRVVNENDPLSCIEVTREAIDKDVKRRRQRNQLAEMLTMPMVTD